MGEAEKKVIEQEKAAKEKLQENESRIKEDIARKSKPTCTVCGRYLFESPRCTGHGGGGGGGGGSGGGEASKEEAKQTMSVSAKPFGEMDSNITGDTVVNTYGSFAAAGNAISSQQNGFEIKFNLTSIAQLLANDDLVINNDKQNGCLTISLKPNLFLRMSDEERKEFKEFINFIEEEFNNFRNNIDDPKKQNKCSCEIDNDPNNLTSSPSIKITISDPKLYDEFIKHLASSINKLLTANNAMSIRLITTHLLDPSKVTNEMRENTKSEHQDFLDNIKKASPETQQEGRKIKITPFQTEPTPNGAKKYREDKY